MAITIALSPIAIASFVQGMDRAQRDTVNIRERLVQTTRAAASSEENMLAAAEQIVRALANLPEVRSGGRGCDRALTDALRGLVFFTNLTRADRNGQVICAARHDAVGRNYSGEAVWQRAKVSRDFVISERIQSPTTNRSVIRGMLPMHNATGFDGVIAIAIDVRWLDYMVHAKQLPDGALVAIFDQKGNIIAANSRDVAAPIFAHANRDREFGKDLYTAQDGHGNTWLYSTAALLGSNVYVGFAMRESTLFGATYLHVGTDFILPFVMLALSWIAIWLVTERQVTRWIAYLRRISAAYRSGHYTLRPELKDAPSDFRLLGEDLSDMADSIQDRDRRLRDALEQKSMLVREIHHRVKNNLQVVMSLLSLQAGRVSDPAAREALKQTRARINALALVHRILHDVEELTTVDLVELISDLAAQTHEGIAGDRPQLRIELDLVPRQVSGDLAVPLSLFTVEALTNVFKHAYPNPEDSGTITVSLRPEGDGNLRLAVEDNGGGYMTDTTDVSVGLRLIETFGAQVGGRAAVHSKPDSGTVAELVFPDPDLHGSNAHRFGEA